MRKTVVVNVVGLTRDLIGPHTPRLAAFAQRRATATIGHVWPAVTCAVQSTYLTGTLPSEHGIVANGWYYRDECEVKLWRQSNRLVHGAKLWDRARAIDPAFTVANHFWWYNMYSSADVSVTPRPMYPADGRKLPDVYTHPPGLRDDLQAKLGTFPLFQFWGPATSIRATQWIADGALATDERFDPTLTLVYLPHLDYCLQRHGADVAQIAGDLRDVDRVCGQLFDYYERRGAEVIVLSEYGIVPVSRPVHLNRLFRERGWLATRRELGRDVFDAGASRAFAMADHQVAHVYVNNASILPAVRELLTATPGVARVLDAAGQREIGLNHPRSGELVAVAETDAWFTYYYWLDEGARPDYADTVDIHRKPGYDPAELFINPALRWPKLFVATTLLRKKLGQRALLHVVPTDASLVKGSHGAEPRHGGEAPIWMGTDVGETLKATDVGQAILNSVFNRESK